MEKLLTNIFRKKNYNDKKIKPEKIQTKNVFHQNFDF